MKNRKNNQPTPEERERLVKDAMAYFAKHAPKYTNEEELVEKARDVGREVHAVFTAMLANDPTLMVDKNLRMAKLGELFGQRYSRFTREELIFLVSMMCVEAIIENY